MSNLIRVEIPSRGAVLEFEPGTSDSVISSVIRRDFPRTGADVAFDIAEDPNADRNLSVTDFSLYEKHMDEKKTDFLSSAAGAAGAVANTIGQGLLGMFEARNLNPAVAAGTAVESGAQGTRQLYGMLAQSEDPSSVLFRFKDWINGTGDPDQRLKQWQEAREFARRTQQLDEGKDTITGIGSEYVNNDVKNALSLIADPTLLIPGLGEAFGVSRLASRAVGAATKGVAEGARMATRPLAGAIDAATEAAMKATGSGATTLKAAGAATGTTGLVMGVPGVREVAAVVGGIKVADKVAEILSRAGANLAEGGSRIGPMESIGRAANAGKIDQAIGTIGRLGGDTALDIGLAGATGAVEGAVIGVGLGYLSGGEEGAAAGFGSGGVLGATGAGLVRSYNTARGKVAAENRVNDLNRFIEKQDDATKQIWQDVVKRDGVDAAANTMDVQNLLSGTLQDATFTILDDAQFTGRFGAGARGVQVVTAGRPEVVVNSSKMRSNYTAGHELFHAFDATEQLRPQAERIKQEIVGTFMTGPDGKVAQVTPGLLSLEEIDISFKQYQRKLAKSGVASRKWSEASTPAEKARLVSDELGAEYMARLIVGSGPDEMLRGFAGPVRSLLDMALQKDAGSRLRSMAERIGLGAKPIESMVFNGLKDASPALNGMLRDLVRARRNLSERMDLAESTGTVLTPRDLSNPIAAAKALQLGVAIPDAAGVVRMKPDDFIQKEEATQAAAIRNAVISAPVADATKPHLREVDGKMSGGNVSPEQAAAIIAAPGVSNKLREVLPIVQRSIDAQSVPGEGNVLFVEHGAATKRVKNWLTGKYSSKYSSGIRMAQLEAAPYGIFANEGGQLSMRIVNVSKLRKTAQDLAAKGKLGAYGADIGGFLSDMVQYFENISNPSGVHTRDLPGMTPEKASYLNSMFGQDEKGGSRFVRSIRLDRITEIRPTGERIAASELAWTRQKMNWMPAEKMPDGQVWSSQEGFRIIEKNGKFILYTPDEKRAGIYDSQQTAELVARMKVANGKVLVAARTILDLLVGNSAAEKFEDRKYRDNLVLVNTPNGPTHSRVQPSRSPMVGREVPASIPKFLRELAKSPESLSLFVDKTVQWLRSGESAFESAPGKITPWFYDKMFQGTYELAGRDANLADLYLRLIAYLSPRASVASNFSKSYGSGITSFISEIARGNRAGTFNQTGSISKIISEWQSNEPFGYKVDGVDNKVLNFYLNGAAGLVKHLMAKGEALPPGIAAHPVLKDPLTMSRLSTNDMWEMASLSHVSEMLGIDGNVWPGFVTRKGVMRFAWSNPTLGKTVSIDSPEAIAVKQSLATTSENGVKLAKRNAELNEQIERAQKVIARENTEKWTPARLKRAGPDRIELAKQRTAEALAIVETAPKQIREWDWSDLTRQERGALKFDSKTNQITVFKDTADGGLTAKGEGPLYDFVQALNGMVADRLNETGGFGGRKSIDAFNVQELKWAMMKGENPLPDQRSYESYLAPIQEVLKFVDSGFQGQAPEAILTAERAFNRWGEQLVAGEVATSATGEWSDALDAARARLNVAGDTNPDTSVLNAIAQRLPTWVSEMAKKFGLNAKVESMRVGTGAYMGDGAVPMTNSAIYVFGSGSDFSKFDAALRGAGSQQGGSFVRQLKAEEALLLKRAKADVNINIPRALDNQLANVLVIKGGAQLNDAGVRALVTDLAALVDAKGKPFMTGLAHLGDEILIHDKYYRGEWINGQFFPYEFSKTHTTFENAYNLNVTAFKSVLQKYGLTHGKTETRFVEAASNPDLIYGGEKPIDPVRSSEVNSRQSAVAGQRQRAAKAGGDVQSLIRQLRGVYLDAARNATPSQGAGAAYTADQLAYTKQKLSENLSKKLGQDAKTAITQLAVDAAVMSAPENAPFLRQQLPAGIAEMVFDSMQAIASGKKIDAAKLARRGSAEFLPTDNPVIQGAMRAAVPKLAEEGAAMLARTTRNVDKAKVKGQESLIRNATEARLKAVKKFNAELDDMQKRGMLRAEDVSTARVNFDDAPNINLMPDTPESTPRGQRGVGSKIDAIKKAGSQGDAKWFSGSVASDANGNPLRLYHGGSGTPESFKSGASRGVALAYFTDSPEVASKYALGAGIRDGLDVQDYSEKLAQLQSDGKNVNRRPAVTLVHLSLKNPITESSTVIDLFGGDRKKAERFLDNWSNSMVEKMEDFEMIKDRPMSDEEFWSFFERESRDGWAAEDTDALPPSMRVLASMVASNPKAFPHIDGMVYKDREAGGTTYAIYHPDQVRSAFDREETVANINLMPDTIRSSIPVGPDVRATTIARIKALSLQAKSLAEKGGLTRAEAVQFRALMGEANSLRFDITRPLTLEKIPSEAERQSTLSARTTLTAREDLMRDKNVYTPIMDAAIGVSHNADTAVDEVMLGKNRDVSPDQFYRAFDATRAALRDQFGDTVHLFRATTQQKAKATTNWATTREFAASFGNNIVEKDVPVSNVLAVTVSATAKYHEVIVGTPPSANINLMPEAMPNGTVYQADFGYQVVNKTGGKFRVYSPLGTIIAVANSLEEAKRVIAKKAR